MISYETEKRLTQLLVALGDGELALERQRQRICEIRDFAPYSAFQRLDRDANERISATELFNFLRDNRCYISLGEC